MNITSKKELERLRGSIAANMAEYEMSSEKRIMLKMLALIEALDTEGKLSDLGEIRKEIESL